MFNRKKDNTPTLNISNVDVEGRILLNDGTLLKLISDYPFLYNPLVKSYNDPDYVEWAWRRITADFNATYKNKLKVDFFIGDLVNRWEELKSLIRSLVTVFDLKTIPPSIRPYVTQIINNMKKDNRLSQSTFKKKDIARLYLSEQTDKIVKLPLERQFEIENDLLNLMLEEELNQKGVKLQPKDIEEITKEAEDFLNQIGFNEVFEIARKETEKKCQLNNIETIELDGDDINEASSVNNNEANAENVKSKMCENIKPCCVRVARADIHKYVPSAQIGKKST